MDVGGEFIGDMEVMELVLEVFFEVICGNISASIGDIWIWFKIYEDVKHLYLE